MKKIKIVLIFICCSLSVRLGAQKLQLGMETVTGVATTSFKGDLAKMLGFSEIEISSAEIDSAFASIDVNAPRWIKELFPGLRIGVDETITKKMSRGVSGVRVYGRYGFIGGSFTVSKPRLTQPLEARKIGNQIKSISLSLSGNAEELTKHLAEIALADANRVKPFFEQRYDLEAFVDIKRMTMGDKVLYEWGKRGANIDFEAMGGFRITADPSPVVDLGSVLFISEKIDSLMEGGLLDAVEDITDKAAEAIQNIVFGKFRDPRVIPSIGWFVRPEGIVNLGGSFSVVLGAELSFQKHLLIKGTKPITSFYGFTGLRWKVFGKEK